MQMIFKVMVLDEVTQSVRVKRREMRTIPQNTVIDSMFTSTPNSYFEFLIPSAVVFGDGSLGKVVRS